MHLTINSHKGSYEVNFSDQPFNELLKSPNGKTHLIIDKHVYKLYADALQPITQQHPTLLIEASEEAKDLGNISSYVNTLIQQNIRRDHTLIAIGGGVIQDITCFLASTLFRGMNWNFFPTTLLAHCDSCIGSKSSINVGGTKNLLGTFHPPRKIVIAKQFLQSLSLCC